MSSTIGTAKGNQRCVRCGDLHWGNYGALCRICNKIRPMALRAQKAAISGVYLVQFLHWYKIGCSSDLDLRLRTIEANLPDEITIIKVWPCKNYRRLETRFHNMYRAKRVKGEWFTLNDDDVKFMKTIGTEGYGTL